jgi:predicted nucleic acid-binding protein
VPLLIGQPQSRAADEWFEQDDQIALWALTPSEVTSALWRLVRAGRLAEADAQIAEERLDELLAASHMVVDVDGAQLMARRLLRVHNLRAADALQLGASILWSAGRPTGRTLLTFDDRLAAAARLEGFVVA